jgi:hypothetical protein
MQLYRLFGHRQLEALRQHAEKLASAWAVDWLPGAGCEATISAAATRSAAGPWTAVRSARGACYAQHADGLVDALFGPAPGAPPSGLAQQAAHAALADLCRRCVGLPDDAAATTGSEAPPDDTWRKASGAARLQLRHGATAVDVWLDADLVGAWLAALPRPPRPAPTPLHSLREAVGAARVRLAASVGDAHIDVATWQSLSVGDVLLLDLAVEHPLTVHVEGQPTPQGAYLGSLDGRRALQMAATAPQIKKSNDSKAIHEH